MDRDNCVKIQMLRQVINNIFNFIENDLKRAEIELPKDFYWTVNDAAMFSMENSPQQLECGSLIDDWEFVRNAYNDPEEALPLILLHIAPLLQTLATLVPSYAQSKGPGSI